MNLIPSASGPPPGGPPRVLSTVARAFPWTSAAALYALLLEVVRHLPGGSVPRALLADAGPLPLAAALAALAFRASRREEAGSPMRRGWHWLGAAFLLSACGDVLRLVAENVLWRDPATTLATIPHFAAYSAVLMGLWSLGCPVRHATARLRFVLDALTIVASAALLLAHFVVGPQVAAGSARLLVVVYPVGDLLALLGVAVLLLRPSPRLSPGTGLGLCAGFFLALLADGLWAYLGNRGAIPAGGLPASLAVLSSVVLLAGVEAHRPIPRGTGTTAPPESLEPSRLHPLPYIAAVIAYGMLVLECTKQPPRPCWDLALGSLGITVAVIARQVLAVRENALLWHERADLLGEARLSALVRNAADTVWILDGNGVVRWASPSSRSMLSTPPEEVLGCTLVDLLGSRDPKWPRGLLEDSRRSPQTPVRGEASARLPGRAAEIRLEVTLTNLLADPLVDGIVANLRDVTERARLENQLAHQAFHDPLTGLCNRSLFRDRVKHALSRSARGGGVVAVCYVDLDDFKTVNDGLGHRAGDSLLTQVARRLRAQTREVDTAARLGGDEFAVLTEDLPAAATAPMLGARLAEVFREPFLVEGHEIVITGSIGIALAAADDTCDSLLQNADAAMYEAKSSGAATWRVYEPSMHRAALESLRMQSRLKAAVDAGEICLEYQPIVRLADGELVGFEALARWNDAEFGLVPPSRFIPLAEGSGLIVTLGRQVLRRAFTEVARARERWPSIRSTILFLNISARQLADRSFLTDLRDGLAAAAFDPTLLCLELTESVFVERTDSVQDCLEQLRTAGIQIGIDDFGTGCSSLRYLHRFPLDMLKIPREFIEGLDRPEGDRTVAGSIVGLGHGLGVPTLGVGIETAGEAEALRALGCELGQGHFFGRPADLEVMLTRFRAAYGLRQ